MSIAEERARSEAQVRQNMEHNRRRIDPPAGRRLVISGHDLELSRIEDLIQRPPRRTRPWPGMLLLLAVIILAGAVLLSACGAPASSATLPPVQLVRVVAVTAHDEGMYLVTLEAGNQRMRALISPTELGQGFPVPGMALLSREILSQDGQGWRVVSGPTAVQP